MKSIHIFLGIIGIIVIGAVGFFVASIFIHDQTMDSISMLPRYNEQQQIPAQVYNPRSDITITNPLPNDTIGGHVTVSGFISGTWFFEGDTFAEIADSNGTVIGGGLLRALDNWMTADVIAFEGKVILNSIPQTTSGTIIIYKDNPSGESQFDDSVTIPITFSSNYTTTSVYFVPNNSQSCDSVVAVPRVIPQTVSVGRASLEALLAGLGLSENVTYATSIPHDAQINSLAITDGIATVDFNSLAIAGSCAVTSARTQITETLLQFPTVDSVVISVNGQVDTALQP